MRSQFIQYLEKARDSLLDLINRQVEVEEDYQKWFEENVVVFKALGFYDHLARPRLQYAAPELDNRQYEEPDFLLNPAHGGPWTIFEIKTPGCRTTKPVRKGNRRAQFYAEFNTYLSQCYSYISYFTNSSNLQKANQFFKRSFSSEPTLVILSGRNSNTDKKIANYLLRQNGSAISLWTYDDLLFAMEFVIENGIGHLQSKNGMTFLLRFRTYGSLGNESTCIVDVGDNHDKNRITLLRTRSGDLEFVVLDADGFRFSVPVKSHDKIIDRWLIVLFEIGLNGEVATLRMDVDGENLGFSEVKKVNIRLPGSGMHLVLGGSMEINRFSSFEFSNLMVFHNPIGLSQKQNLLHLLESQEHSKKVCSLKFTSSLMHTGGHPHFPHSKRDGEKMDLVAPLGLEPVFGSRSSKANNGKRVQKMYSLFHKETIIAGAATGIKFLDS